MFQEPLAVSMGVIKDQLILTIVDGTFFSSYENGIPIPPGTEIELPLPKLYGSQDVALLMETAQGSVETAANTLIVG